MSAFLLACLLLIVLDIASDISARQAESARKEARVRALVKIGMDINDAIAELRTAGIGVTSSYDPTGKGQYLLAVVTLHAKRTVFDTLRYTTSLPIPGPSIKAYVVITADPDGTITEIE